MTAAVGSGPDVVAHVRRTGLYRITLTATNATGQSDSDSKSVVVAPHLVEVP